MCWCPCPTPWITPSPFPATMRSMADMIRCSTSPIRSRSLTGSTMWNCTCLHALPWCSRRYGPRKTSPRARRLPKRKLQSPKRLPSPERARRKKNNSNNTQKRTKKLERYSIFNEMKNQYC